MNKGYAVIPMDDYLELYEEYCANKKEIQYLRESLEGAKTEREFLKQKLREKDAVIKELEEVIRGYVEKEGVNDGLQ